MSGGESEAQHAGYSGSGPQSQQQQRAGEHAEGGGGDGGGATTCEVKCLVS